ncbi:MAG: cell envelope integrity protein TolA [Pseudomonadota bacterium]
MALHLVVITLLVVSIEPPKKLAPTGPAKPLIEAKAVNLAAIEAKKNRQAEEAAKKKQAEIDKRKKEEKKRQAEAERKRLEAEEKKLAKQRVEQAQKKREAEEKQAEEKARKLAEDKKRAEQEKAAAEKKRQEEIKRKKEAEALAEKKKAEEKARKLAEEKARQEALADALAAEEAELAAAAQAAADENEISKYMRAIASQVTNAFRYPPGLEEGMTCVLYVRMIPGGEVIEARVTKSSGSPTFDRQAENAVRKAAPLSVPEEPRLFNRIREVEFVFDPSQ